MPTIAELSAGYGNFLLGPRRGPDVCGVCFNFTAGYDRCYACAHGEQWLDVVVPISYSVGGEQLHHALRGYKRPEWQVSGRFTLELAAVLWRFLSTHERCLASACGVDGFEIVTAVPPGEPGHEHPLRWVVAELVGATRARHRTVLARTEREVTPRVFDARRFDCGRGLGGASVLLIDDTWTSGASAQSAAAALKASGAGPVAGVVIGRHLNREWHENDRRLRGITLPFDWDRCALCAVALGETDGSAGGASRGGAPPGEDYTEAGSRWSTTS